MSAAAVGAAASLSMSYRNGHPLQAQSNNTPDPQKWPGGWASDACSRWQREWNYDWDGRASSQDSRSSFQRSSTATSGKARRLLLIRHGQYELEDKAKTLTELGRRQAKLLAERLVAKQGSYVTEQGREHQVIFAGIWSSDVVRARETAEIIAEHLPSVPLHAPDPLLAEGVGALALPQWQHHEEMTSAYWEDSARIELAFRRYFHRQSSTDQGASKGPKSDVSFEIIVCHCNVIRYFVLRALQLPPEAWLRFGGYNTGITEVTIHSDGTVTLESFGDTGHLPLEMTTFH